MTIDCNELLLIFLVRCLCKVISSPNHYQYIFVINEKKFLGDYDIKKLYFLPELLYIWYERVYVTTGVRERNLGYGSATTYLSDGCRK